MQRHVSYWLVPAAAERAFFQERIDRLEHNQQAPTFVPHVTVYSGESPVEEDPLAIITQATRGVQEVRLQIADILCTDAFTKTLFVQFHPSALLSRMAETMRRLSARPSAYRLDPHLSLMYKNMGEPEKQCLSFLFSVPQRLQRSPFSCPAPLQRRLPSTHPQPAGRGAASWGISRSVVWGG